MNYFIAERQPTEKNMRNASNKARADVEEILSLAAYQRLDLVTPYQPAKSFWKAMREDWILKKRWQETLKNLVAGDRLVIQFPLMTKFIFLPVVLKELKRRGIKVIILIHDLESLRHLNRKNVSVKRQVKLRIEEEAALNLGHRLIVHNDRMKAYLLSRGYASERLRVLEIFDYLHDHDFEPSPKRLGQGLMIAGNLDAVKAGYLAQLPQLESVKFQLFGAHYDEKLAGSNMTYHGAFMPQELPGALKGSFGLVWDGASIQSCTGVFGDYLRYNNPHKTSLYLSSGFPVIVWKEAAISSFVLRHGVGLVVSSLTELSALLSNLSEEDYQKMVANVAQLSQKMRQGSYLLGVLSEDDR